MSESRLVRGGGAGRVRDDALDDDGPFIVGVMERMTSQSGRR